MYPERAKKVIAVDLRFLETIPTTYIKER